MITIIQQRKSDMELKECPFCGADAIRAEAIRAEGVITCYTKWCPLYFVRHIYEEAWNTRTPSPAVARVVEAARKMLDITHDSRGVDGYHLNGNIAEWDEFPEVIELEQALTAFDKQDGQGEK